MSERVLKFGKHKDKKLSEIPSDYLDWLMGTLDQDDKKFGKQNKELFEEIQAELELRVEKQVGPAKAAEKPDQGLARELATGELLKDLREHIETIYNEAREARELADDLFNEKPRTSR